MSKTRKRRQPVPDQVVLTTGISWPGGRIEADEVVDTGDHPDVDWRYLLDKGAAQPVEGGE